MYKCRYCGRSEYIRGMRYLLDCYLYPPKKEVAETVIENTEKSNTVCELWVCQNCYASESSFDNLAKWEDDE